MLSLLSKYHGDLGALISELGSSSHSEEIRSAVFWPCFPSATFDPWFPKLSLSGRAGGCSRIPIDPLTCPAEFIWLLWLFRQSPH